MVKLSHSLYLVWWSNFYSWSVDDIVVVVVELLIIECWRSESDITLRAELSRAGLCPVQLCCGVVSCDTVLQLCQTLGCHDHRLLRLNNIHHHHLSCDSTNLSTSNILWIVFLCCVISKTTLYATTLYLQPGSWVFSWIIMSQTGGGGGGWMPGLALGSTLTQVASRDHVQWQ